jgi:hypothetical protein
VTKEILLTQEYLRNLFKYSNGKLFWKERPGRYVKAGTQAGCVYNNGYCVVTINNKRYGLHRIIFMMHHGYFPNEIDHIDGNKANNNIDNLRAATRQQNKNNTGIIVSNTSGYKNVSWNKKTQKWKVELRVNEKKKHLGIFKDLELADLVATMAREKYHGEYANHG